MPTAIETATQGLLALIKKYQDELKRSAKPASMTSLVSRFDQWLKKFQQLSFQNTSLTASTSVNQLVKQYNTLLQQIEGFIADLEKSTHSIAQETSLNQRIFLQFLLDLSSNQQISTLINTLLPEKSAARIDLNLEITRHLDIAEKLRRFPSATGNGTVPDAVGEQSKLIEDKLSQLLTTCNAEVGQTAAYIADTESIKEINSKLAALNSNLSSWLADKPSDRNENMIDWLLMEAQLLLRTVESVDDNRLAANRDSTNKITGFYPLKREPKRALHDLIDRLVDEKLRSEFSDHEESESTIIEWHRAFAQFINDADSLINPSIIKPTSSLNDVNDSFLAFYSQVFQSNLAVTQDAVQEPSLLPLINLLKNVAANYYLYDAALSNANNPDLPYAMGISQDKIGKYKQQLILSAEECKQQLIASYEQLHTYLQENGAIQVPNLFKMIAGNSESPSIVSLQERILENFPSQTPTPQAVQLPSPARVIKDEPQVKKIKETIKEAQDYIKRLANIDLAKEFFPEVFLRSLERLRVELSDFDATHHGDLRSVIAATLANINDIRIIKVNQIMNSDFFPRKKEENLGLLRKIMDPSSSDDKRAQMVEKLWENYRLINNYIGLLEITHPYVEGNVDLPLKQKMIDYNSSLSKTLATVAKLFNSADKNSTLISHSWNSAKGKTATNDANQKALNPNPESPSMTQQVLRRLGFK